MFWEMCQSPAAARLWSPRLHALDDLVPRRRPPSRKGQQRGLHGEPALHNTCITTRGHSKGLNGTRFRLLRPLTRAFASPLQGGGRWFETTSAHREDHPGRLIRPGSNGDSRPGMRVERGHAGPPQRQAMSPDGASRSQIWVALCGLRQSPRNLRVVQTSHLGARSRATHERRSPGG